MMSTATEATSSQDSSDAYQRVSFLNIKKTAALGAAVSVADALLDAVDLGEDSFRADFLGVGGHHRIHRLLHGGAIGEGHALELAFLLHLHQLLLVLARLDLAAVRAGFLAGPEHRGLQRL